MSTRPAGRGVFYTRDSGGEHETTPGEYVRWAQRDAAKHGVRFAGTPDQIDRMIRGGVQIDFHKAGADRRELTQKILLAQLNLSRAGFSTRGRAP
jgi:hypothetical protein